MSALTKKVAQLEPGTVAVIGMPSDAHSSFMRGAALAPAVIREVLEAGSTNWCAENGIDLGTHPHFCDLGDLALGEETAVRAQIEAAVGDLLKRGTMSLALGGDHSITYPILRAYKNRYDTLHVLHLDAHPDMYDEYDGDRYSHACPFARVMEEGLVARLTQIGIRTMNPHQRAQAERFGVRVIEMKAWRDEMPLDIAGPLYLSLDMDVLDPAFAPGVSHHEPGGMSTRQVIDLIHRLPRPLVGADIVEFNPRRDPLGITAMAAGKLLKEIAGRMLEPA